MSQHGNEAAFRQSDALKPKKSSKDRQNDLFSDGENHYMYGGDGPEVFMTERSSGTAAVVEKLREFERLSAAIGMARTERLSILNLNEHAYLALCSGNILHLQFITAELERRLSYALPMMRRMSRDNTMLRSGFSGSSARACAA